MKGDVVFVALSALLAACAKPVSRAEGIAPARNVPASDQTIVADVDQSVDGQSIYVTNNSSVPITVTSVRLSECINVGSPCTLIRLHIRVAPGSRIRVFVVRPSDPEGAYSYKYSWTWGTAAQQ